jgi:Tol biopolymer transport system component
MAASLMTTMALTARPALAQKGCIPPPPGMVAWWSGDKTSLDPVGGINGAMMNGATFAPGKVGQAFKLDGTDDYVQIPFDSRYNFLPTGQFTIELWMNPGRVMGSSRVAPDYQWQCLVVKSTPDTVWDWGIYLGGDKISSGSQRLHFLKSTTTVAVGAWYHVAVTYNAGSMTLYVNGLPEATGSGLISQSDGALALGRKGDSEPHPDFYQGLLDEVAIYRRALSASEVQAIYKAGTLGKCRATATVPVRLGGSAVTGEPAVLLQEAQHKELVDGQPAEAIEIYRGILTRYGTNRTVAATALVQMGQCYEKLGNVESRKAYERVLREFADQRQAAEQARTRLAALNGRGTPGKRPTMAARRVWDSFVEAGGSLSRDGSFLSMADSDSGNLVIRDVATGELRHLTKRDSGSGVYEFTTASVPSPDGTQVAYAWSNKNQRYDLRVVGLDRSSPRVLVADQAYVKPGDWSPDGKWIPANIRKQDGANQIVRVSFADGSVQVLRDLGLRYPSKLGFSPDGRYIVYDLPPKEGSSARDIFLLSADGSREIPLVQHPANDFAPVWTPDGSGVVFVSDRLGAPGLWMVKVSDGKPEAAPQLVKADVGQMWPMGFARNGSLYYGLQTATEDIYLASLDRDRRKVAGDPLQLAKRFAGSNYSPDWSQDGRFLAYASARGPLPDEVSPTIVIRSLDTEQERDLTPKLSSFTKLYWSPDERSFIVRGQDLNGVMGIFRVDAQSGEAALLVAKRPEEGFLDLVSHTKDHSKIILTRSVGNVWQTSIRDLGTGVEKPLPVGNTWACVSPDGRWVVTVARDRAARSSRLTVLPTAEGNARHLLEVREPEVIPGFGFGWSPDGEQVWFVKYSPASSDALQLWHVPFKPGNPEPAGLTMKSLRHLKFHPDGSRIAFISGEPKYELWVLENFLR